VLTEATEERGRAKGGQTISDYATTGHRAAVSLCAEQVRQLGGASPLSNRREVKE